MEDSISWTTMGNELKGDEKEFGDRSNGGDTKNGQCGMSKRTDAT
jgi:hypothetical protein